MLMHTLRMDISCTAMAFLLPTFGKRAHAEVGTPRKRQVTAGTPNTTKAAIEHAQHEPPMQASSSAPGSDHATELLAAEGDVEIQNLQRSLPRQAISSVTEPDDNAEHAAAGVETTMFMQAIVTEWSAFSTDEAREVVHAAQIILKGNQTDLRNLCKPWGVQLRIQKRYRPTASIKQDLKMALTRRVQKLKNKTQTDARSSAAEHTGTEDRAEASVVTAAGGNSSHPAQSNATSSSAGSAAELTQSSQGLGTRKRKFQPTSKSEVATGGDATDHADAEDRTESAVMGAALENSSRLLQSVATSSTAGCLVEPNRTLQNRGTHIEAATTNNYPNLFQSPEADLVNAFGWAHANAMHPPVAAWLLACSQWEAAVANKEHQHQKKRRTLCKEHGIPLTSAIKNNKELDTAMVYIRRQLINRINDIRASMLSLKPVLQSNPTRSPSAHSMQQGSASADIAVHPTLKKTPHHQDNKLHNYFTLRAAVDAAPEIEELHIPDVATDVNSTYLRLHGKRHIYADDVDFLIVKNALSELRAYVNKKRLHEITTDPPKKPKTIRQFFKERNFKTANFDESKAPDEATGGQAGTVARHKAHNSHTWRTYYIKLLVLAQARRWLTATERLDPSVDLPPTPKTNFQLADAIKDAKKAEYAPFGSDFEDPDSYSPVVSRLLFYAEIHNCSDHGHGTFSTPKEMPPYTYRQLQVELST